MAEQGGPLKGVRVIELCNTFAGPACARMMADFGAEVIKVEPPDGDPVRQMGHFVDGISLQAVSIQRGKRSLVLDLKTPQGQQVLRDLLRDADVLIENNRPGVMERLGFGWDDVHALNPRVVMVRISGYGQTGPNASRPGYGAICDAFSGVRELTGDPDRPPSRVALATTDYLTAVYSAFGAMMALFHRQQSGRGQLVDAALYETGFSMMEGAVPAFEKLGLVPTRQGPNLPNVAPNSLYPTSDGYVLIAANNGPTWERLVRAIERPELLVDARFASVYQRGQNAAALDAIIALWTREHTGAEVEATMLRHDVPSSRVFTIADVFRDPHFAAREMLLDVPHPVLGSTRQQGIVPKLSETPGAVRWSGPEIGADSVQVLSEVLGYSTSAIQDLIDAGVVVCPPQPTVEA
ncbi:CaiB/BaiF CoA-transferase family protein [Hydrogenophaga sp.]|uniref:CaiB/BaiF CoA transferase family protein n=1 Tax=Hydrogenophaga sp. TaxID=1904254 RepID=UPI0027287D03|nr:CoA transferase [Hydrogenophaga sp.]MDO9435285.1 CoA transferase [Hydrogenophaga sp.]